jgi:HNH endonuclease
MDWGRLIPAIVAGLAPVLPQLLAVLAVVLVLRCPMPGRGPRLFQRADPWRLFKYETRRLVMSRAGNRCEGAVFLAWGRCRETATEADHVYPWSRGGPTSPRNGQALCSGHNRHKAAMQPPWWYLLSLENRRRSYFPPGEDVRVSAAMSVAELTSRAKTPQLRSTH